MTYTLITNLDQNRYEQFVKQQPQYTLLQNYFWAQIKTNFKPIYIGIEQDNQLVSCALLLIRKLVLNWNLLYIPHGPICDYEDKELLEFMTQSLKKIAKQHHCILIKAAPYLQLKAATLDNFQQLPSDPKVLKAIQTMTAIGWQHQPLSLDMDSTFQPRFEAVTHITLELFNNYPQRLKKALKYIEKRNVNIIEGGVELLDELANQIKLTEQRQNVSLRNREYFEKICQVYQANAKICCANIKPKQTYECYLQQKNQLIEELNQIQTKSPKKAVRLQEQIESFTKMLALLEPIKEKETFVIGALLAVLVNDTLELLYAGTDVNYSMFFPQEAIYSYLMAQAYQQGIKKVSMGGIDGHLNDGLLTFKSQFNPHIYEMVGEFDYPTSWLYYAFKLALRLKKR